MQLNPLIKNCFIERVYKSNNIFGKFSLGVKTPQYQSKERFGNQKINPEK